MLIFCAGDTGDGKVINSVLGVVRQDTEDILILASPTGLASKVFTNSGQKFSISPNIPDGIEGSSVTKVVCGTSAKDSILQINATRWAKDNRVPVIWVEDFYLTSCCKPDILSIEPDHICTLNDSAKSMILSKRPKFNPDNIHVMGQPAFDGLVASLTQKARLKKALRNNLGIPDGLSLVSFFASSGESIDMFETLIPLVSALDFWAKSLPISLCVRFHPAEPQKEEYHRYVSRNYCGPLIYGSSIFKESEMIMASDLVIVQHSTVGVLSVLLGVRTMFVLLPSVACYQESRGNMHPYFPEISKNAALGTFKAGELKEDIFRMLLDAEFTSSLEKNARLHFIPEAGASGRVAKFVLS